MCGRRSPIVKSLLPAGGDPNLLPKANILRMRHKSIGRHGHALSSLLLFVIGAIAGTSASAQTTTPDRAEDSAPSNPASIFTPLPSRTENARYAPITADQRLRWLVTNTLGPVHLTGGLFTSAFGTAVDRPKEYGPHWGGFADRYGMRLTGIVTGNAIETGAGFLLHEDPRYFRVPERPFKSRVGNVVRLTFMARRDDGNFGPAYGRYLAISGNNFLSNSWRVDSEANTHDAILRTAEGSAGRMAANAFEEFWPDVRKHVFHKHP
jgi:hypothetical protein